jgi:hypothetical protein
MEYALHIIVSLVAGEQRAWVEWSIMGLSEPSHGMSALTLHLLRPPYKSERIDQDYSSTS